MDGASTKGNPYSPHLESFGRRGERLGTEQQPPVRKMMSSVAALTDFPRVPGTGARQLRAARRDRRATKQNRRRRVARRTPGAPPNNDQCGPQGMQAWGESAARRQPPICRRDRHSSPPRWHKPEGGGEGGRPAPAPPRHGLHRQASRAVSAAELPAPSVSTRSDGRQHAHTHSHALLRAPPAYPLTTSRGSGCLSSRKVIKRKSNDRYNDG